ncbi:hypothetical protein T4C_2150 [Trichinella pseudospiralis]|uniref:Apple domain-containing protein n=1 Tax=Trichinella pseudospiralis TaxID=6337 RepID=A0A0V1K5M6_TRIPS|nr:hypothetical protein T4C_2150 [Trichinella pseudospiralis]
MKGVKRCSLNLDVQYEQTHYLSCSNYKWNAGIPVLKTTLGSYRQIYVPSMDRFCLLGALNINGAEVQDFLKQKVCSRYKSLGNRTFFSNELVDDNEFYKLVNCTEAADAMDTFINEETEIETDFNKTEVIALKVLHEVCTIERLPFADSIKAKRITLVYPKTMEICLAQCRMSFSTVTCNAFLYSLVEESCILLHYNDIPQTQNEIRKSSSHFYKILNCDSDGNDSEVELAELTDTFISWASPQSSDSQSCSSESEELQQSEEAAVNNLNLVQIPEAPSTSSYANTKVEIKENFKTVQGVYDIDVNHRVYSLNKCLHLCRSASTTIRCQAVLFLQKKHFCRLLVNGLPQNFVITKDGEELVFMITCYKVKTIKNVPFEIFNHIHPKVFMTLLINRIKERLDNPPPMNYYLEEMKEICVVEAYKLQNLSEWAIIANITDFYHCQATFKSPRLICGIQFKLKSSVNQIQKCKFYKNLHRKPH